MRRALALLVALLLTASAASATEPQVKAFRAAAKTAEKQVRVTANASVVAAKGELASALSTLVGDGDLTSAFESAARAVASAAAGNANTARASGSGLASDGAALLAGLTGQVPADFLDGGDGAWDDFKARSEAHLRRVDVRVAKLFTSFARKAGKLAKSGKLSGGEGFDADVRFAVRGHDALLDDVGGPLSSGGGSLAGASVARASIVVDVRFLLSDAQPVQTVGVHHLGVGGALLRVTDGDGGLVEASDLAPDADGVIVVSVSLAPGVAGPVATLFIDADDTQLAAVSGSAPTGAKTKKSIVKAFRVDLKQHLSFGAKQLRGATFDFFRDLADLVHAHALGVRDTRGTLETALSVVRAALGADCFWLDAVTGNPVDDAADALAQAGFDDADVSALFAPDGDGDYARFLAKLERKRTRALRVRDKLLDRFVKVTKKRAKKQGETLSLSRLARSPAPLAGRLLDVAPASLLPESDPQVLLGVIAHIEGDDDATFGLFAGLAKDGLLASTKTTLTEDDGDPIDLSGLQAEFSGAFEIDVPELAGAPTLGFVFRTTSDQRTRPSTLLLATPRVDVGEI